MRMGDEASSVLNLLRSFMFENVYLTDYAKKEEETAMRMISAMYSYFSENKDKLPLRYIELLNNYDVDTVVCDYISSMTDRYAVYTFEEIFIPKSFYVKG